MVGLLIAQSTMNELKEPVLYLTPTTQLVNQTFEKAKELGMSVVKYEKGEPLSQEFVNGKAIMIATYSALFNGKSKFGVQGKLQFNMFLQLFLMMHMQHYQLLGIVLL